MVGKAAAGEKKKRGRPRKKDGLPSLGPGHAPAATRGQDADAPPPLARRSERPRRPPRMDDFADYRDYVDDIYWEQLSTEEVAETEKAEDDEEESDMCAERGRREKKFRLLQKLQQRHRGAPSPSPSSSEDDSARGRGAHKKGRSCDTGRGGGSGDDCEDGGDLLRHGSGGGSEAQEDRGRHDAVECSQSPAEKAMNEFPVSTPLPDKKVLEAILHKLQKKDTYGVYAEPVDPEELPDYHDIIKNPMDFSTIRQKLATGAYCYLEQFESDIFLVCTNAMQYNAPDTIYFRQARSIQDLATKKFHKIRCDSQHALKSEQKIQSSPITMMPRKRSVGKSAANLGGSDIPLPATCISTEDASSAGRGPEQAFPTEQPPIFNGTVCETSTACENKSEKGTEHSAKSAHAKVDKKLDVPYEDRRATYDLSNEQLKTQSDPPLTIFDEEQKSLVYVGLDTEYSYARSLARFAGSLGPVAWKIASEQIEKALPAGTKFGRGWVGEYEPIPMPVSFCKGQSADRTHILSKITYQETRNKDEMKSSARKCLQSAAETTLDSTTQGMCHVSSEKGKHLELTSSCENPFQTSSLFGFNAGFQSTAMSSMLLQGKPFGMVSPRDCRVSKVSNGAFFSMSESVAHTPVQTYEQSKVTACVVPEASTSSRMDNRGLSDGNDVRNLGSKLGFVPIHQTRVIGNLSSHGGKEQAIGDPTQLVSMQRKVVNDDARHITSTVTSPRGNGVAVPTSKTPVWIPVGRSSRQNVAMASDNFKVQAEDISVMNFPSESVTPALGFHGNHRENITPAVHQLPSQATGEEYWMQGNVLPAFPQVITTELSRYRGQAPRVAGAPQAQHSKKNTSPPDLNITFPAPKTQVLQSSGMMVDSQKQPDLALQL